MKEAAYSKKNGKLDLSGQNNPLGAGFEPDRGCCWGQRGCSGGWMLQDQGAPGLDTSDLGCSRTGILRDLDALWVGCFRTGMLRDRDPPGRGSSGTGILQDRFAPGPGCSVGWMLRGVGVQRGAGCCGIRPGKRRGTHRKGLGLQEQRTKPSPGSSGARSRLRCCRRSCAGNRQGAGATGEGTAPPGMGASPHPSSSLVWVRPVWTPRGLDMGSPTPLGEDTDSPLTPSRCK